MIFAFNQKISANSGLIRSIGRVDVYPPGKRKVNGTYYFSGND